MADPRYYAKIDVGYFDNPKIAALLDDRPDVVFMHLRAILYCRQHIRLGDFPIAQMARLSGATYCGGECSEQCSEQCSYCEGVHAGLFERSSSRFGLVHDYAKHQESPSEAKARSDKASHAAKVRWEKEKGHAPSNAPSNAEERRGEESSRRTPRATQLPPDWSPTPEHEERAKEHGLDLSWQATKFRLHAEENGRTAKSWNAAFTRWLMNAKDFERPAPAFQQRLDAEKQRADKAWGAA